MPPEPTKAKLKRRASRRDPEEYKFDGGHARELELKRSRGEIFLPDLSFLSLTPDCLRSGEVISFLFATILYITHLLLGFLC